MKTIKIAVFFLGMALCASYAENIYVKIGKVCFTDDRLVMDSTNNPCIKSGKAILDKTSGTLTLDSIDIDASSGDVIPDAIYNGQFSNWVIKLIGDNKIKIGKYIINGLTYHMDGIASRGAKSFTIDGNNTGALTINAPQDYFLIFAPSGFKIKNCYIGRGNYGFTYDLSTDGYFSTSGVTSMSSGKWAYVPQVTITYTDVTSLPYRNSAHWGDSYLDTMRDVPYIMNNQTYIGSQYHHKYRVQLDKEDVLQVMYTGDHFVVSDTLGNKLDSIGGNGYEYVKYKAPYSGHYYITLYTPTPITDDVNPYGDYFLLMTKAATTPTSAISATEEGLIVYGLDGKVRIAGTQARATIYNIGGAKVYEGADREIALPSGIYVVRIGEMAKKVIVK